MSLLKELREEIGMSIILITHDIGLVASMADRVLVMYAGQIIEEAPAKEIFRAPRHPYTKALLSAIPVPDIDVKKKRVLLQGELSSPINPKPGCRFAPRCPYAAEECRIRQPLFEEVMPDHFVACHKVREINQL